MSKTASSPVRNRNRRGKGGGLNSLYLDIGGKAVLSGRIVGIFDMDNVTTEKATVEFLNGCEKAGKLENLCTDIPVSFVVCEDKTYLSPLAGRTLAKALK